MEQNAGSKIDFLMMITNTQNAVLARALNFDASYISRIRANKRGLPPKQPFVEPASEFFARNVRERYQRDALAKELGLDVPWPEDVNVAAHLIASWLNGHPSEVESEDQKAMADESSSAALPTLAGTRAQALLFSGNAGRRESVLAFLSELAEAERPFTLLLQSDEDMSWLYEDKSFTEKWAGIMRTLAAGGSTFMIVHTISRDANEMWEGVQKWIPLYMTGAIKPYYYPRLRDGVRNRSLFIARGKSALIGNSVKGMEAPGLSIMLHDPKAVLALEREFETYLNLCKPLMRRIGLDSPEELKTHVESLFETPGKPVAADIGYAFVCAKEEYGAIVASKHTPHLVFAIEEPRLASALSEYLNHLPNAGTELDDANALLETLLDT